MLSSKIVAIEQMVFPLKKGKVRGCLFLGDPVYGKANVYDSSNLLVFHSNIAHS